MLIALNKLVGIKKNLFSLKRERKRGREMEREIDGESEERKTFESLR